MKKLIILFLVAALFAGCRHDDLAVKIPQDENYLPLEVGNYWNLQPVGQVSIGLQAHREVMGVATINNHEYFLLVTSYIENSNVDSAYYRMDTNGFVHIYRKNQPNFEDNRFRLFAKDGDKWKYPVDGSSEAEITLTVGSLTIGNAEIANCKSYFFNVTNWADEEYTITLAPGIGFAKEYSNAWGFGQILKSARIHGQVYNFQ
ncbi:hypothetical protein WSM22_33350 [Cytophagales bacterium WSM2-2]|nr:hypothetical protein WSM22_33350 [Cytophagales bacterium WSM2-2]